MTKFNLYPTKTSVLVENFHDTISLTIETAGSSPERHYFDTAEDATEFAEAILRKISEHRVSKHK